MGDIWWSYVVTTECHEHIWGNNALMIMIMDDDDNDGGDNTIGDDDDDDDYSDYTYCFG